MTDTMLERVARALCAIECRSRQGSCMECFEACWREFDDDARAVIRAVFEGRELKFRGPLRLENQEITATNEVYIIDKAEVDAALAPDEGSK